jgi:lysine 2,3-aminomutase
MISNAGALEGVRMVSAGTAARDHGLPPWGYATPRIVCDVPYVGKRWVHQLAEYDRELGISYWTKNYRTGIELEDPEALDRRYPYYNPISTLGEAGQKWWSDQT